MNYEVAWKNLYKMIEMHKRQLITQKKEAERKGISRHGQREILERIEESMAAILILMKNIENQCSSQGRLS